MLRKKWLSLLVAISMVAAMFPSTVFANETDTVEQGTGTGTEIVTNAPEEKTPDTEGNETPDVVTDEDTTGGENTLDADKDKSDEGVTVTNTEEEPPAEGTQPEETTEETKVEETKPEQPTVPETTPAETPNSTTSEPTPEQIMAATQNDISTTAVGEEATPKNISVTPTNANDLQATVDSASEGDTIVLAEGEYNIGILSVKKAVNFKGAGEGKTKITGAIYYQNIQKESLTNVTVRDLTLQYGSGNQGICVGGCKNIRLNVLNCQINDYLFGIGVNSGSTNCIVDTKLLTLENVWCGTGICTSDPYNNKLYNLDTTEDSTVQYAVQAFASGLTYNNYYYTEESYKADVNFTNPDQDGKADDFQTPTAGTNWPAEAKIGNVYYGTLEDAVGAATNGTDETPVTITLTDDVELDKMLTISASNVVLDLNQKTITAAGGFTGSADFKKHLIQVEGDNVTITNGNLTATSANRHVVNVWGGNVTLSGVTLDHSNAYAGAPLVINGGVAGETGSATLDGNVTFVTGDKSWYNVNVDKKAGNSATLTVAAGANVTMSDDVGGIAVDSDDVTLQVDGNIVYNGDKTAYVNDTDVASVTTTGSNCPYISGTVAKVGNVNYTDLQAAVNAIADSGEAGTVELVGDVDLTAPIQVPGGADIDIIGNDHTISFNGGGAFSNKDAANLEGLTAGTKLDIENVNFKNTNGQSQGYAVIVGFDSVGTEVSLDDCSFDNMYCAVLANPFNKDIEGAAPEISITNSKFNGTTYGYSIDEKTDGAQVGVVKPNFAGNTGDVTESEPWSNIVLTHEGTSVAYSTLADAVAAAVDGDTITLGAGTFEVDKPIVLDKKVTIQGSGEHTVIQSKYKQDYGNGLFTFTGGSEGSTLKDVTIEFVEGGGTGAQQSAVYFDGTFGKDETTTIENVHFIGGKDEDSSDNWASLAISSTYTEGGNVTISGCEIKNFKYGMYFNGIDGLNITGNKIDGTKYNAINIAGDGDVPCNNITIKDNTLDNISAGNYENDIYASGIRVGLNAANVSLENNDITMASNHPAIYFDPTPEGEEPTRYTVTIMVDGVVVRTVAVGAGEEFTVPAVPSKDGYTSLGWSDGTNTYNPGAKVKINADTTFTALWQQVSTGSTGSSHEHSYVWQGSPDEHWQYCTECGQVVSNGAHTFQWKDGVQVCSVCGYKVTQTSSTSTAPAGSTAAAAAAPAAGTTATAAATGIPQTSDNSNPMLWVVLLALSGSALGGMTIYKKKKEN